MSQQVSEQNEQSDSSRETLKVTLLGGGWTSSAGGLATLNRELAIHLSQHPKVEVSFLVPDGHFSDKDKREAQSYGITVVGGKKRLGYEPLDWLSAPPEGHKMDVVVGHGAKLGRQVQFIKDSARFQNCKWVQVVHTAPEDLSKYKGYSDPISRGEKKHEVEVDLCKLADLVVPVGPRLEKAYSSYLKGCKRDIFPVIPGLFDREFGNLEQSSNENAEFRVLLCGRGDEEDFELKGYNIAVNAFTDHLLKKKPYHLIFVGAAEGKQEEVRERLLQCGIAEEQLTVRKFVQSRERMKDLLCEVNLAIMPSRSEGFGLVALEALSAGLPILVSRKSGFASALENIPFGESCIVNSDEPAKWAEAIEGVRVRHRVRLKEIKLLRTSYHEQYNWKKQCESFVKKLWTMVHDSSTDSMKILRADPPIQEQSAAAAPGKGLSRRQPSSEAEKKGCEGNEEDEPSGEKSLRKERKRQTSGPTFDLDRFIRLIISAEDLNDEEKQEMYEILAHNGQRYVKRRNLSEDVLEKGVEFFEYLTETLKVNLVYVTKSSLKIVMYCPTLESLEQLWSDYLSGHLNKVAERLLVTDEIKRKFNLETVRFKTTIEKENYLMCRKVLMEMSGEGAAGRAHLPENSRGSGTSSDDQQRSSSKGPSIPGVQPLDPVCGNLSDMAKAGSVYQYLVELHEKYGEIVGFWWGKEYAVSLSSVEYWKEIQPIFDKPYEQFKFFEPLFGKKSLTYQNGPEARKKREVVDRSFSHEAISHYYECFTKIAKQAATKFDKFAEKQEHIPLEKSMMSMAIKSILFAGMGRFFMDEKEISKMTTAYEECWNEMEARLAGPIPSPDSDREKKFQEARKYMKEVVKNLLNKRKQEENKETLFIDSILDCDLMDEEEMSDTVITFLVGGFHTTGYSTRVRLSMKPCALQC